MLAGSNYLDLAGDERVLAAARAAVDEYGGAAGGSRLINGNLALHEELEAELARFAGHRAALLFSTGYMANLGVLATLAGPDDAIVSDSLNHASIVDACRLSRAQTRVFRHNDPRDLERVASGLAGFRRRILVTDGVYSMDGDVARLAELVPVARAHDMIVVLDDAHGLGALGPSGRGTAELEGVEVDVAVGNLGKALGSFGAYVACSETVRSWLINAARSFIFTCGLAPAAAGAARAALQIASAEPQRRKTLHERAEQLRAGLRDAGFDTGASTTHIVPAIVGDNARVMALCEAALERGIYAQGIRFPSVPRGTERIRFTPTSAHKADEIAFAVRTFAELRSP
ncbi:MAG: aminotransferase class I/II-fold pyridoxal phosphate-dependent enzyme [Proteobacteria bacterium]|nr:aminotransferase class I/II-fold pyridoxal phosphate-dependent enzyme [Pseudomonadota bacterium]